MRESKREKNCRFCGKELPKYKTRFCCDDCRNKYNRIKKGLVQSYEMVEKTCVCCGKPFATYKQARITCSDECAKKRHAWHSSEYYRRKYLKIHPDARTREDIVAEAAEKKAEKEREKETRRIEREKEREKARAQKEAEKIANIEYWQNYNAEHICAACGCAFTANYPTKKYCSDKCKIKARKTKKRYKDITVDRGITLQKLAQRDGQRCRLCGGFVNWDDYKVIDGTTICGDEYPSIDHVVPVSLGGLHSWENIQLAHRKCNMNKSNKFIG